MSPYTIRVRKAYLRSCAEFCAGVIRGRVENLKLRGEVCEEFSVTIRPIRSRLSFVWPSTVIMTCEHGQAFAVREKPKHDCPRELQ